MANEGIEWSPELTERFTAVFALYDLDGNGIIEREEYSHLLDRIAKVKEGRPAGISRNAFLFHRFDLNNDGFISLEEFLGGIEDVGKTQNLDFEELAAFFEKGPSKKACRKKVTSSGSPGKSKQSTSMSAPSNTTVAAAAAAKTVIPTVPLPPELEEKYELVEKVGKGGFATVYKARAIIELPDVDPAQPFAIKVVEFNSMAAKESGDPGAQADQVRAMTISEVDIMARVCSTGHNNIIKLYEVSEHVVQNQMWIVIEYMGGGDLEGHVKQYQGLSEMAAINIFTQVCQAVDYCHNVLEVVHRDLKPENILILEPATSKDDLISVKLADFGLATSYESTKVMKLFCGTPYFFAPELVDGSGYSRAVDCWSLGVISYFILSSKLPFMSKIKEELNEQICSGEFEFPLEKWEGMSISSKDLIERLLNVNALKRYSVKEAIDHPWMLGERTIEALAPTVFDMLRVESNDHRES